MVYPLPTNLIKEFASKVDVLYVIEELDPFIEEHVKGLGIEVKGKDVFSLLGEYSQNLIKKVVLL
jgi:indolepyruvate ferredoxin oxidoreductase alpha subunit